MPIWKGAITARRFAVSDNPSTWGEGWRDKLRERIEEYAFRRPQRPVPGEEVWGFVLPDNLLETDFSNTNRWHIDPYVLLGLRCDKTVLPKEKVLAETKSRANAWCQERGVERCPSAVRRAIKEQVEEDLRGEARTKTTVVDVAWNTELGYVLAGATSTKVSDEIRKRFFRAFGCKLAPTGPLRERDLPALLGYPEAEAVPADLTLQMLSWIHLVSEDQDGRGLEMGDERAILVTDRVSFIGTKDTSSVQIKGEQAGSKHEAKTAVADGRLVSDAKVEFLHGAESVGVTILAGELPDMKSLKFLGAGDESSDPSADARVERLVLYEGIYDELVDWAARFAELRADNVAWQDHLDRRAEWAGREEPAASEVA